MVVPSFGLRHGCPAKGWSACHEAYDRGNLSVPGTYLELTACIHAHKCAVFGLTGNLSGSKAHSSTDVQAWQVLAEGAAMPVRCIDSEHHEPYVVLRHTDETPTFDEDFYGYHLNKIELIIQLRIAGYSLEVVGKGFLCHVPHLESTSKVDSRCSQKCRASIKNLLRLAKTEWKTVYTGVTPATPMCK